MMRARTAALVASVGTLAVVAVAGLIYVKASGLRATAAPSGFEAAVARSVRRFAVPAADGRRTNPVALSDAALAEGLAHYADHCASCHAIDGSGSTALGQGLFPKAPDMRAAATQAMTDGELFYVIEHGIRFTGMPGWTTGTAEGETGSWQLVHVIRHLPKLTEAERARMESLLPRSAEELRQEIDEEEFLNGGDVPPQSTHSH
jgi:mono/diheme cytochrome c family protein